MNESITVLGIMSGSSLDGMDLAWLRFPSKYHQDKNFEFEWLHTVFHPYSPEWKKRLETADTLTTAELLKLDVNYAKLQAEVIRKYEKPHFKADLIGWHGHTIFHQPKHGYSFQLGRGDHLATSTDRIVINDLRNADIAKGGHGAPLAPIVDQTFFKDHAFLVNLGGICNLTINNDETIAFDVCGFNQVLNHLAFQKGWEYDKNGELSENGSLHRSLLNALNEWGYLSRPHPKSLSNQEVQNFYLPLLNKWDIAIEDKMKTFMHHVCDSILRKVRNVQEGGSMLLSGGGAYNKTFVRLLEEYCPFEVSIMDLEWIDYKEAFLMAFMGYLRWQEIPNVLSSVTGSTKDHSTGIIHFP